MKCNEERVNTAQQMEWKNRKQKKVGWTKQDEFSCDFKNPYIPENRAYMRTDTIKRVMSL